jgi:hypothetical protein
MPSKPSIPRTCKQCGEEFLARPDQIARGVGNFCSKQCRGSWYAGERSPLWEGGQRYTVPRTCKRCGKDFLARRDSVKAGNAQYCSQKCEEWPPSFGWIRLHPPSRSSVGGHEGLCRGTSLGDGTRTWPPVAAIGRCASRQRYQNGQPPVESHGAHAQRAQNSPQHN